MSRSPALQPPAESELAFLQDEMSGDNSRRRPPAETRKNTMGKKQPTYNTTKPMYDYERIYPPDAPYHETDEDARVWHVYNDEAAIFDKDMIEEAGDSLDILLIFAALFSGVVTTFVVQSSGSLDTNYGEVSANLLQEMVALQRAGDNDTARATVPTAEITTPPSNADLWVNGLWFTSLVLSLSTALLAVLAKQWLRQYSSVITGSARERAFVRQFRWEGFKTWHVQAIIGILPTILHLSLGIFLAGLVVFLYSLDIVIARIALSLSALLGGAYVASTVLPVITVKCPYRTQFSTLLTWSISRPLYVCAAALDIFLAVLGYVCLGSHFLGGLFSFLENSLQRPLEAVKKRSKYSARNLERSAAIGAENSVPERAPELALWMVRNTTSSSAKRIAFQSLATCKLDNMPYFGRFLLFKEGADWPVVKNTLSDTHLTHDSIDIDVLRRWMCATTSADLTEDLGGLNISLPSIELAIITMGFGYFISDEPYHWWPERLTVKSATENFVYMGDGIKDIHRSLLEHYDPSNPPYFPQHIWTRLQKRNCLPEIQDGDEAVWKPIVDEVLIHKNKYLTELELPDSHQLPISLARYYAPMLKEKGWLELKKWEKRVEDLQEPAKGSWVGESEGNHEQRDRSLSAGGQSDREEVYRNGSALVEMPNPPVRDGVKDTEPVPGSPLVGRGLDSREGRSRSGLRGSLDSIGHQGSTSPEFGRAGGAAESLTGSDNLANVSPARQRVSDRAPV